MQTRSMIKAKQEAANESSMPPSLQPSGQNKSEKFDINKQQTCSDLDVPCQTSTVVNEADTDKQPLDLSLNSKISKTDMPQQIPLSLNTSRPACSNTSNLLKSKKCRQFF